MEKGTLIAKNLAFNCSLIVIYSNSDGPNKTPPTREIEDSAEPNDNSAEPNRRFDVVNDSASWGVRMTKSPFYDTPQTGFVMP